MATESRPAHAARPIGRHRDGPWTALMALPVVALVLPAGLVLSGPLRSNGWPARLLVFWIAIAFLLSWLVRRVPRHRRVSPAEIGCWILLGATVASILAGGLRGLAPGESAGLVRAALVMVPLLILALGVAASADRERIEKLVVLIVVGAGISAFIGAIQFFTPFNLLTVLDLPGLSPGDPSGQGARNSFVRVVGSTAHPIELAVISGAVVPLALHLLRFGPSDRIRRLGVVALTLMAISVPMSVSRSGIVVAVVSMLVYGVVLNNRQRLTALVVVVVGAMLFRAAVPGLLGALKSMFLRVGVDDSVSGRTDDYEIVGQLVAESPFVGRGLGTFRPEEYFFLDNQYLMTLIEGGYIGLFCLIAWFLLVMSSSRGATLRAPSEQDRSLGQAITAAVTSIGVSGTLFDLFSFGQVTVLVFLLAGMAGALWHEQLKHGRPIPPARDRWHLSRRGAGPRVAQHARTTLIPARRR